jgi:hypothetical protein
MVSKSRIGTDHLLLFLETRLKGNAYRKFADLLEIMVEIVLEIDCMSLAKAFEGFG